MLYEVITRVHRRNRVLAQHIPYLSRERDSPVSRQRSTVAEIIQGVQHRTKIHAADAGLCPHDGSAVRQGCRAIEVNGELIDGPGKLCRALEVDRSLRNNFV